MKSFLITASIDVATRMSAELANNYGVSFSGVEDSHPEIIGALLVLTFAEDVLCQRSVSMLNHLPKVGKVEGVSTPTSGIHRI